MIELMVLISDTASAPPALAARAGWRMSVMLGVSFTITGMRVYCLHQRATISMYSGTWPTAEPMPRSRHAVRAAEVELDAVGAGLLDARQDRLPALLLHGTMIETTMARSGKSRLTCLISCRLISSGRSVMSSMLLKPSSRRSGPWIAP